MSGVMWGSAGVFVRELSAAGMDSTTIVLSRVFPAMIMMLLLILATDRSMLRIRRKDAVMFLACGLSMLIVNVSYTISAETLSLSFAAVLLGLSPVFMLILARVVFGERITAKKTFCMVAAVFGCVLVSGVLEGSQTLSLFGVVVGLFGVHHAVLLPADRGHSADPPQRYGSSRKLHDGELEQCRLHPAARGGRLVPAFHLLFHGYGEGGGGSSFDPRILRGADGRGDIRASDLCRDPVGAHGARNDHCDRFHGRDVLA